MIHKSTAKNDSDIANSKITKKALEVSTFAHEGQKRRNSDQPYIIHPIAVAQILKDSGVRDDDTIAAALLHDVLEDVTPERYSRDDMLHDFGQHITELVDALSETKKDSKGNAIPWIDRKKAYIKNIKNKSDDVLSIAVADKIHNISSLLEDYALQGEPVWKRFNSTPKQQHWYYKTLLDEVFYPQLGSDNELVEKLTKLLDTFDKTFGTG